MWKLCLGQVTVDFFNCPNMETFASWDFLSHTFENHDQALIKWCLWPQNKMLTKNFYFWLPNDHFAPTVDFFNCPNMETFASWDFLSQTLRIMIKHWSNDVCGFKMRCWPKIWTFDLSNDHVAPVVDCRAIRVFDCAILCCESWNLVYGCLTVFIGMWDLFGPLETSISLPEPKP